MNLDYKLKGRFALDIIKVDSEGNEISRRRPVPEFDNLITDFGLDSIGTGYGDSAQTHFVVGSGNTTPTNADTLLAAFVAGTNGTDPGLAVKTSQFSTLPYYWTFAWSGTFDVGVAAGNLSEVGVALDGIVATSKLWCRALIVDGGGSPTTITVLSDEKLQVTYTLYIYLPNGGADITGTFSQTIDGTPTSFSYTLRSARTTDGFIYNISPYSILGVQAPAAYVYPTGFAVAGGATEGALTAIDSYPTGTIEGAWQTGSETTYVSGTYQQDFTYNLDTAQAVGTWGTIWFVIYGYCTFQMAVTPTITKDNTKIYSFTTRLSWSRYP